jgi:hypothetical protein
MKLGADQRRALRLLADAKASGCTEALLLAHGFTAELVAGLVRAGWATAENERVRAGSRMIDVPRVKITDAGRRAISAGT